MKWQLWLLVLMLVLFLPIAFLAAILLPNEYVAQGISGGVDCDGPISVMILAIPSYFVYGLGGLVFYITYNKSKKRSHLSIVLFCCLVMTGITPNVVAAIGEHNKNELQNIETCGSGW